jgi:hypothetical protein
MPWISAPQNRVGKRAPLRHIARMSVADLPIQIDREKVAAFCRERGIRKLSLFGSVLREDFDPQRSDVDVLVEYAPGRHPGLNHFRYQDELAAVLPGRVDFNTPAMLGKYFRDRVLATALALYEHE